MSPEFLGTDSPYLLVSPEGHEFCRRKDWRPFVHSQAFQVLVPGNDVGGAGILSAFKELIVIRIGLYGMQVVVNYHKNYLLSGLEQAQKFFQFGLTGKAHSSKNFQILRKDFCAEADGDLTGFPQVDNQPRRSFRA